MEKMTFEIFGQSFHISTQDGEKDDLLRVIRYYKKALDKIYEKNPQRSYFEIAVLAGITITDELYTVAKNKNSNNAPVLKNDVTRINQLINEKLKDLEISLKL